MTKHKATPESLTLGKGQPGDPERMEHAETTGLAIEGVAYEKTDVDAKALVKLGVVLTVATVITAAASFGIFRLLARHETRDDPPPPPMALRDPNRLPPEPRLQTQPAGEFRKAYDEEHLLLDRYGWVDKGTGTVRIPIEEAMRLYVERAAAPVPSPAASPSAASSPVPSPSPAGGHP